MSRKFLNSLVVLLILILSVGCGFLYDILFTQYRLKEYPRQYNDTVISCYYEYAVPVSVIYATVKMESDYDSSLVSDDGRIGLMQLTRDEYDILSAELGIQKDSGLLFEPETNLNLGTYRLSKLYEKYQSWRTVFSALFAGEDTVDGWLSDTDNLDEAGDLVIPDPETEKYVDKFEKTVEIYRDLYESAN
ncbi:MAG: transglycosylase SLT domain-containing protein [Clostridia bacterium]|nr:transglycosylase SLT domain-containing protein [Clostridia bacterium]